MRKEPPETSTMSQPSFPQDNSLANDSSILLSRSTVISRAGNQMSFQQKVLSMSRYIAFLDKFASDWRLSVVNCCQISNSVTRVTSASSIGRLSRLGRSGKIRTSHFCFTRQRIKLCKMPWGPLPVTQTQNIKGPFRESVYWPAHCLNTKILRANIVFAAVRNKATHHKPLHLVTSDACNFS